MKVLLVEQNIEMLRLLKAMISDVVDEIHGVRSGDEAVEIYSSIEPDWVVMDIFRKPTNGLSAAALIKELDADAKIVFISNYTDERTKTWAAGVGGSAFFGKDDLLSLVEFLRKEKEKR